MNARFVLPLTVIKVLLSPSDNSRQINSAKHSTNGVGVVARPSAMPRATAVLNCSRRVHEPTICWTILRQLTRNALQPCHIRWRDSWKWSTECLWMQGIVHAFFSGKTTKPLWRGTHEQPLRGRNWGEVCERGFMANSRCYSGEGITGHDRSWMRHPIFEKIGLYCDFTLIPQFESMLPRDRENGFMNIST